MAQSETVRGLFFLSLWAFLGCEPGRLVLTLPFDPGARSALVLVEGQGRNEVYGVDLDLRRETPVLVDRPGVSAATPLEVTVASYAETLSALALMPGLLRSTPDGALLPTAQAITAAIVGDSLPSFAPLAEPPAVLRAFRRPATPECVEAITLAGRWDSGETSGEVVGLAPLVDGGVGLVYTYFGDRSEVLVPSPEGGFRTGSQIPSSDLVVRDARVDAQGRLWLAGGAFGAGGRLGRWVNGAYEPVLSGTDPALSAEWLDGIAFAVPEEGPDRVYAVTQGGGLVRVSPEGLVVLDRTPAVYGRGPALAVAGPEDVYFVRPDGVSVSHYDHGLITTEPTEVDAQLQAGGEHLLSLAVAEDGTAYAGTRLGIFLRRDESGRWRQVAREVLVGAGIWALAPFGTGVISGGEYGAIQQAYPSQPLPCAYTAFVSNSDVILSLWPRDGELWVGGTNRDPSLPTRTPFLARMIFP